MCVCVRTDFDCMRNCVLASKTVLYKSRLSAASFCLGLRAMSDTDNRQVLRPEVVQQYHYA